VKQRWRGDVDRRLELDPQFARECDPTLSAAFGAVATLLAALGLYGVVSVGV